MILVCHKILQDHVVKDLCDFMARSSSVSHHPVLFGGDRHCGSGGNIISIRHLISQDHVTYESCDFIDRSLLKVTFATKRYFLKMCYLRHRLRIFSFRRKVMFRSQDIQVFAFLVIP